MVINGKCLGFLSGLSPDIYNFPIIKVHVCIWEGHKKYDKISKLFLDYWVISNKISSNFKGLFRMCELYHRFHCGIFYSNSMFLGCILQTKLLKKESKVIHEYSFFIQPPLRGWDRNLEKLKANKNSFDIFWPLGMS